MPSSNIARQDLYSLRDGSSRGPAAALRKTAYGRYAHADDNAEYGLPYR